MSDESICLEHFNARTNSLAELDPLLAAFIVCGPLQLVTTRYAAKLVYCSVKVDTRGLVAGTCFGNQSPSTCVLVFCIEILVAGTTLLVRDTSPTN